MAANMATSSEYEAQTTIYAADAGRASHAAIVDRGERRDGSATVVALYNRKEFHQRRRPEETRPTSPLAAPSSLSQSTRGVPGPPASSRRTRG